MIDTKQKMPDEVAQIFFRSLFDRNPKNCTDPDCQVHSSVEPISIDTAMKNAIEFFHISGKNLNIDRYEINKAVLIDREYIINFQWQRNDGTIGNQLIQVNARSGKVTGFTN